VFVRVRVGPALALGLLAGAPLFAQSPGNVSSPKVAATARKPVGLPLPEKYAKQFGTGARGAQAAARVLENENATREQLMEALGALTYYGHDGAQALGAAALRLERESSRGAMDAAALTVAIALAMMKVPDRGNTEILTRWAESGKEVKLRVAALNGLTELITSAGYEGPRGSERPFMRIYGQPSPARPWHSVGERILPGDFETIERLHHRTRPTEQTSVDERHAWESFDWWVNARKAPGRNASGPGPTVRNGGPLPPGTGGGGFGTSPATE